MLSKNMARNNAKETQIVLQMHSRAQKTCAFSKHKVACSSSVRCSGCKPVPNVVTDLLPAVRGHADGMKCVFVLNTIYPCLDGQKA